MKKYFVGLVALLASLNMVSAFADCPCKGNKLMASVCSSGSCATNAKAAPAAQATAPAQAQANAAAPVAAKANPALAKDAKDKVAVVAPQEKVAEEDSEDEE